jgi:hypothetical protein
MRQCPTTGRVADLSSDWPIALIGMRIVMERAMPLGISSRAERREDTERIPGAATSCWTYRQYHNSRSI